jgi:hypothetical protein
MSTVTLTVAPDSYQFAAHEATELRKTLAEIDRQTIVVPAASMADFMLTVEAKTSSGYKFSHVALTQLCALVGPGLVQLILDLSGQWRKPGEDRRLYSSDLAVEILNRILRLRFDRKLLGLQLVKNTKLKVIDGIVGSKYRYLANSDFLDRVDQACAGRHAKFHEAFLYGRQLVVRYSDQSNVKPYVIAGDQYAFGYHFANSEIGGRSVRAATLLVRCVTGDSALWPFADKSGGRVVHSGRDFEKRLHGLLDHITMKLPLHNDVESGGRLLEERSLKLGTEDHERRIRYLAQILTRRKLTQNFAKRVVSSAASRGRNDKDSLIDALPIDQRLVLTQRSAYDLFTALIHEARKLPIDQRETAEQVAYALLSGKIGI